MFIIFLIGLACGSCCNGNMGNSVYGWSRYTHNVKNQGDEQLCWAYSALSHIENSYNKIYQSKYILSTRQIDNNINELYATNVSCYRETTNTGGYQHCALDYVRRKGIMTQLEYDIIGYDDKRLTPIGVKSYERFCPNKNTTLLQRFECLKNHLAQSTVLTTISATSLTYIDSSQKKYTGEHHGVLITDLCVLGDETYVEYQNSWGSLWGCGGFGYILLKKGNNITDGRHVLTSLFRATIYMRNGETVNRDPKIVLYYIVSTCSFVFFVMLSLVFILTCKKSDFCCS